MNVFPHALEHIRPARLQTTSVVNGSDNPSPYIKVRVHRVQRVLFIATEEAPCFVDGELNQRINMVEVIRDHELRAPAMFNRTVDRHEFASGSGLPPPREACFERLPNPRNEQLLLALSAASAITASLGAG